jgi:hypothetical protein
MECLYQSKGYLVALVMERSSAAEAAIFVMRERSAFERG